jgi:L-threonylcarbamoyladenylate synthase
MPSQPAEYAAILYAVLHALDDAGIERIVIDLPPDEEPWLAIRDRLRRGSTDGTG